MADEKWNQIFSKPITTNLQQYRHDTPRVPRPTCPEHCSGNHKPEGIMMCPRCQVAAYKVVAHEWLYTEGHYFYVLESMNGSPMPPVEHCTCKQAFVRVL